MLHPITVTKKKEKKDGFVLLDSIRSSEYADRTAVIAGSKLFMQPTTRVHTPTQQYLRVEWHSSRE